MVSSSMRRFRLMVLTVAGLLLWADGLLLWCGDAGPVGLCLSVLVPQVYAVPPLVLGLWCLRRRDLPMATAMALLVLLQVFGPMGFCLGHASDERADLRVATYNVDMFLASEASVAQAIDGLKTDLVCIQEASPRGQDVWPAIFVKDLPGRNVAIDGSLGIVSRWPIRSAVTHRFAAQGGNTGWNVQEAVIDRPGHPLRVLNAHQLPDWHEFPKWPKLPFLNRVERKRKLRDEFVDYVLDRVAASREPVVLCGDFNQHAFGPRYRRLADRLTDAYRATSKGFGYTLTTSLPTKRVDSIFSRGLRPLRSRVPSLSVSDHLPVVADLASE